MATLLHHLYNNCTLQTVSIINGIKMHRLCSISEEFGMSFVVRSVALTVLVIHCVYINCYQKNENSERELLVK